MGHVHKAAERTCTACLKVRPLCEDARRISRDSSLVAMLLPLLVVLWWAATAAQRAFGPLADGHMGWVVDHAHTMPHVDADGMLTIQGDSRVYLVEDASKQSWVEHKYVRIDLTSPLVYTLDLSKVCCCSRAASHVPHATAL